MSRWNIRQIAFYGAGDRRRTLNFNIDQVNIVTGASGTGKTAIIDAIDYCLGASKCGLPFYVRKHAQAVAVHWVRGDRDLIVGRLIPNAGKGTGQMFVRTGKALSLPGRASDLEGKMPREYARMMIERSFGIGDIASADDALRTEAGRATVRDLTPFLLLSADTIISSTNLLHDLNRSEKVKDIKAAIPYYLGAIDQDGILAERRLRQLEAALSRYEKDAIANEKSRGRLTERAMALLSQASALGLADAPSHASPEKALLRDLTTLLDTTTMNALSFPESEVGTLEDERQTLVGKLGPLRERRRHINRLIRDASGCESAVDVQRHKLALSEHFLTPDDRCPICQSETDLGRKMSASIRTHLAVVSSEVSSVQQFKPELVGQLSDLEDEIEEKSARIREIEAQISALIVQADSTSKMADLSQARAVLVGRVSQFLETTVEDFDRPAPDLNAIHEEVASLYERIDAQAKRDRLRDAENMVSTHASAMLVDLPTKIPAAGARLLFAATPKINVIEPKRRTVLSLKEVGSDQNYLSIHLALAFALQKHFQEIDAPVPGLLVLDQVSRPYYAEGDDDEKTLEHMKTDEDRTAMRMIVDFIFKEVGRQSGLQVILIEHAYLCDDERYVKATGERWTRASGEMLIPPDWPERS